MFLTDRHDRNTDQQKRQDAMDSYRNDNNE